MHIAEYICKDLNPSNDCAKYNYCFDRCTTTPISSRRNTILTNSALNAFSTHMPQRSDRLGIIIRTFGKYLFE